MTPDLHAVNDALNTTKREVTAVLVACSLYVQARAGIDPEAAALNRDVQAAFDRLILENINARQIVAEHEAQQKPLGR